MAAGLLLVAAGCGGDGEEAAPVACDPANVIGGQCAGVPPSPVCDGASCTAGVSCAKIVQVAGSADLAATAASAAAGTCIALAPAAYGAVTLPGGVSLLGKSADAVKIEGVTLQGGSGSVLRGLGVGTAGVAIEGTKDVRIEAVHVSLSPPPPASDEEPPSTVQGIFLEAGSSVEIVSSTVSGTAVRSLQYGLRAAEGVDITIERAVISNLEGPGIWLACGDKCGCADPPSLSVTRSIVRDNRIAGMAIFGTVATLDTVDILRTAQGEHQQSGLGGGGLSVAACSTLEAVGLRVHDSLSYGVLVDSSGATLGGDEAGQAIDISRNELGLWVQNVGKTPGQEFRLENAQFTANKGVGIGLGGEEKGIIIFFHTAVTGTTDAPMPVLQKGEPGFSKEVGDGLVWLDGVTAQIDGLALSGNERASLLIDGGVGEGSSLKNVTLAGGDKQIVQQNWKNGDLKPATDASVPAVKTVEDEPFVVPEAPQAVTASL
ncbi:MAG: right-handed parallel beta-helix repeat-containing protein [Deltaproteobacteria bacterium]|nr:right-handed parallel beta-helix repeat-containing protein [Deltaproteobacteria bacterium]